MLTGLLLTLRALEMNNLRGEEPIFTVHSKF